MELLQDFRVFDYLHRAQPHESARYIADRRLKRGENVYLPGDHQNHMYEIVRGAVKLGSYNDGGEEVTYEVLKEGDFFGNLKYLEGGQFFEFARTLTASRLRVYDLVYFRDLIVHDPKISEWFNYYVVSRWCRAEKKLLHVNYKNVSARVAYLYEVFNLRGRDLHGEAFTLFDLLTKKDLGDLAGSTRQTVAKALRTLHRQGVIPPPDTGISTRAPDRAHRRQPRISSPANR